MYICTCVYVCIYMCMYVSLCAYLPIACLPTAEDYYYATSSTAHHRGVSSSSMVAVMEMPTISSLWKNAGLGVQVCMVTCTCRTDTRL